MKIEFEDRTWELDIQDVDVKQATVLYLVYKMTLREWVQGLGDIDQRALHFAYWLMLQQNGVIKPIADCNPQLFKFAAAFGEGQEAETAEEHGHPGQPCDLDDDGECTLNPEEAEPDPTRPGTTPDPPSATSDIPTTTTRTRRGQKEAATA